ncbi:MAG: acyl-CoA dehydrogenase family protein [Candidatus Dormibacteraceae bacterium]
MISMLERAHTIADEVLFPASLDVDAEGAIPSSHFDLLAKQGFYGLARAPEPGGSEIDFPSLMNIVETLSGGCLTTTFTWLQHHALVLGLTSTTNVNLREKCLNPAIRGELRSGVALAGAIPRPPRLWVTATEGGWLVSGDAPFVSGWGIVDVLLIAARDTAGGPEGTIVSGVIEAQIGRGIAAEELPLVVAVGSNTVRLHFEDYFLPLEQVIGEASHPNFLARQRIGSRLAGCLAMGVAGRCIRMIAEAGQPEIAELFRGQQDAIRIGLDGGLSNPESMPAARAAASELAYRAGGTLMAVVGSSGIFARQHAQRLVREAMFTLVAASRPEIKHHLLDLFSQP